jgi:hypothetical protein
MRGAKSHPSGAGMRGYDLPAVIKLLQVHGPVSHHLLFGTWERDRPPGAFTVYMNYTARSSYSLRHDN